MTKFVFYSFFSFANNSPHSAQLVKTAELSPKKNYILGCHPHGIMSAGAFACFSTESCGFAESFPGVKSHLAILAGLFRIPFFREYVMGGGIYICFNF